MTTEDKIEDAIFEVVERYESFLDAYSKLPENADAAGESAKIILEVAKNSS